MQKEIGNKGIFFAGIILGSWLLCIILLMQWQVDFKNPLVYIFVFVQMHLYTGLFITAHDAMHGTVAPHNNRLNFIIGQICTALYAAFPFKNLYTKHHEHHNHVHTKNDPDYYEGHFFAWYFKFIKEYITIWQIVLMAIIFNILQIWIPQQNLLLFWVLPSLLSTLQLFYFGTYLPHKGDHDNHHYSKSLQKNHFLAFITCYFFGYHYEHHDRPATPWWRLWRVKNEAKLV